MYLQFFIDLIHNLNKCFSHYETHVVSGTLSHYHIIYLIVKLTRIDFMFIQLENCFISIGPFINTLLTVS
jgi:hypothetical protein